MLEALLARRLAHPESGHRVQNPLVPSTPKPDLVAVDQGHYRIGSQDEPFAYDNELPPQAVELSGFRIAHRPVSNAAYLAFMEAGGYGDDAIWSAEGRQWHGTARATAPLHWRRDASGHWHGVGLNGPVDLQPDEPVSGIGHHEALAFAAWTASLGGALEGAVLQHEYQWEVAARSRQIAGTGRVWEWCANPFHPYPQFSPSGCAGVTALLRRRIFQPARRQPAHPALPASGKLPQLCLTWLPSRFRWHPASLASGVIGDPRKRLPIGRLGEYIDAQVSTKRKHGNSRQDAKDA